MAKEKPCKIYDSLGLFVLVKPNGSKLRRQTYKLDGKPRMIAHGSYPVVSLRGARSKRDEIRDPSASGTAPAVKNPLDQIETEMQARNTFLLVAEEYLQVVYDRELADATMRKKICIPDRSTKSPQIEIIGPVHRVCSGRRRKKY